MEFGKGWEGESGDWGKGRRNMNMHLQQFFSGFSVSCCGSKQKTGTKEESSKKQHICDFEPEENQDRNEIYGQAAIQCLRLQKRKKGNLKAL